MHIQFCLGSFVESDNLEHWNSMEDDIKVDLGGVHWTELHQDSSYYKPPSLFDLGTEAIEGSPMGYFPPISLKYT